MKAREESGEIPYPKVSVLTDTIMCTFHNYDAALTWLTCCTPHDTQGAHPGAVAEYAIHARNHQSEIPTTPKEASEYWEAYEKEHPEYIVTARTNFAKQFAEREEAQTEASSKRECSYSFCPVLRLLKFGHTRCTNA